MARAEIEGVLRHVTRQIRRRRAERLALRGAFWGAVAAAVALLFKGPLGLVAVALAGALFLLGTLGGAVWGAARRVRPLDAAWLTDRAYDLADRVATTLEWAERPDRPPLVAALVEDTLERLRALEPRTIVRRVWPGEVRWLPVPLVVALALAWAPPLPLPDRFLPDLAVDGEEQRAEERGRGDLLEDRARPAAREQARRPAVEERDFAQRAGGGGAAAAGDLAAIFKDTALASQRPDFNSFLKKGDERLRLLEQVDRLPDLQTDFTNTQYKMIFRRSKELTGGLRPDQISPQKLRELLEEMERLGRKGGGSWGGDASEGMEALEYGQTDRALEAMKKALDKMRAMEEQGRAGKGLRGGRESGRGREPGRGGESGGDDFDYTEGEGLLPGRGKSASPKGEASQRLRANPYDVGVEGEARRGRKQGYDTNLMGRTGPMPSRLQYLGVVGQYRKMMEDAITREQVPRDYHAQIRDYFQALDER
jgi:hypothetical protein